MYPLTFLRRQTQWCYEYWIYQVGKGVGNYTSTEGGGRFAWCKFQKAGEELMFSEFEKCCWILRWWMMEWGFFRSIFSPVTFSIMFKPRLFYNYRKWIFSTLNFRQRYYVSKKNLNQWRFLMHFFRIQIYVYRYYRLFFFLVTNNLEIQDTYSIRGLTQSTPYDLKVEQ